MNAESTDAEPPAIDPEHPPLSSLLAPRSIAVVGASGDPASPFARPVTYLLRHGFPGDVVPVNPKYDRIEGLTCHPSLRDVPGPVDLVVLMTPAASVVDTLTQAAERGTRAAVVCSSGFAEYGPDGDRLQRGIAELSAETGMRVLGPNSQGLIFGPSRLAATFTAGLAGPPAARGVAYVGQSGAIGGCVLDNARELGLDIAAWVSTGNQVDLDAVEVAGALVRDSRIDAVMLYVETVPDGRAYAAMADRARRAGKPVVVLRSGRSDSGRRANVSHTGAALGPNAAFELASARHGVILADDPHELLLVTHAAVSHPRPRGDRVGIVTTSGGAGAVAADHCERLGLRVPTLSAELRAELSADMAVFGSAANPVDLTAQVLADASRVGRVCAALARSGEVDAIVFIATMVTGEAERRLAADLAATIARADLPFLTVWLAGDEHTEAAREILGAAGLPVFRRVDDAVRVLGRLHDGAASAGSLSAAEPMAGSVASASGVIVPAGADTGAATSAAAAVTASTDRPAAITRPTATTTTEDPATEDPATAGTVTIEETMATGRTEGRVSAEIPEPETEAVPVGTSASSGTSADAPPSAESSASSARVPRPELARALGRASGPTLVEGESLGLLDAFGIPRPEGMLARTPDEAARAARRLGDRVVMKLQSPAIPHKSDIGGVRVGVPVSAARAVFEELMAIGRAEAPDRVLGVLVQRAAPPATEVLIGVVASGDGFPPVLSFGLGGTEADLYEERSQTLLPVDRRGALELVDRLRAARLLRGFRGRPPADVDALASVIVAVGELCAELGDRLLELEINPLRVYPDGGGVLALDFLLRLDPGRRHHGDRPGPGRQAARPGEADEPDEADRPGPVDGAGPRPITTLRRTP